MRYLTKHNSNFIYLRGNHYTETLMRDNIFHLICSKLYRECANPVVNL